MRLPLLPALALALSLPVLTAALPSPAHAQYENEERLLVLATGPVTDASHAVGGAIQRLVNRALEEHGLRILLEATSGDAANERGLNSGQFDLVMLQGELEDKTGQNALFSLTQSGLVIAVRVESDIKELPDLSGRKLGLNDPEDRLFPAVWASAGLAPAGLSEVRRVEWAGQAAALCGGDIDVLVVKAAPPHAGLYATASTCRIRFVGLPDDVIRRLSETRDTVVPVTIPAEAYPGVKDNVSSVGIPLMVVAREELEEQAGFDITKTVFEAFDDLRRQHPSLIWLSPEDSARHDYGLPRNPGATQYFEAVRLLPEQQDQDASQEQQ
ncbi:MAG: TAXI family TRAP transporter solute-binding subunit [Alphaproteobacteria bacterium]